MIIFVMMHLGQKQRISQGEILRLPWLKGPYPNDTLATSASASLSIYSTLIMDAPIIALTLLHDGFSMVDDDQMMGLLKFVSPITDNNHLFGPAFSFPDLLPICFFFCIYRVFKKVLAIFQSSDKF